jgi:Rrf2 family iron-sulfur cluster assembly transcriptional regulator
MDEAGICQCEELCFTHMVWAGLGQRIKNFLASITLDELSREASMIRQGTSAQRDI